MRVIIFLIVSAFCTASLTSSRGESTTATFLALLGTYAACGAAFWVDQKMRRPARTYFRLACGAALVGYLFVLGPATHDGLPWLGFIAWIGVTIIAAIWCIYYEHTTPMTPERD